LHDGRVYSANLTLNNKIMTISASDVATLRAQTGAGMMDCKKALDETNGDMAKAVDYLFAARRQIVDLDPAAYHIVDAVAPVSGRVDDRVFGIRLLIRLLEQERLFALGQLREHIDFIKVPAFFHGKSLGP
jgi:hypothetical protein